MLKALELTGFKSFADKTRFEFPPGITVVVGPNGSGKSNVVDAIKWVLGEQSAKSLRGKEMSDVIFKGSAGPDSRKPANSAIATIVLDNSDKRFPIDTDEVLVSRRVYRSGEAEYLINNETCRLKDIREMFRGTGIGTDAYSLIEQGKVDRLLQASPKERRAIFEEAAGISRFKAKKIEAERRLARVDGNLIRLADIVEEVGSRYRSIKNQATKAAQYKEYASRLQELRTYVSLKDWRAITETLTQLQAENRDSRERATQLKNQISESEQQADAIEQRLESLAGDLTEHQQRLLTARQNITEEQARQSLNESRIADLLTRQQDLQLQQQRLTQRQQEFQTRHARLEQELADAQAAVAETEQNSDQLESDLQQLDHRIADLTSVNETSRRDVSQLIAMIGELGRLVSAADSQIESLNAQRASHQQLVEDLTSGLAQRRQALAAYSQKRQDLEQDAAAKNCVLAEARKQFELRREQCKHLENQIAELKHNLIGKTQRNKVLLELEKRLEGIDAGTRQLLDQARKSPRPPFNQIVGVVADMVTVNVQHAGIVDVALGNAAQYLVVDGYGLIEALSREELQVKGRVGIIQIQHPPTLGADPNVSINGEPGVIGRADRLVQVNETYAPFVRRLLGGTWIVQTLADAISLYNRKLGRIRLVTLDGEIVEADGSVIVGPQAIATGLVSRRSELRMLSKEIQELTALEEQLEQDLKRSRQQEQQSESQVQNLLNENAILAQQLADIAIRSEELTKQISEVANNLKHAESELAMTVGALSRIGDSLTSNRTTLGQHESRLEEVNQILMTNEARLVDDRTRRQELDQEWTRTKIERATREQQRESFSQQQQQIANEIEQLSQEMQRTVQTINSDETLRMAAQEAINSAVQALNQLETQSQQLARELERLNHLKFEVEHQRRDVIQVLNAKREQLRHVEDELHKSEMKSSHLQVEQDKLVERLQEDYGIDMVQLSAQTLDESAMAQRDAVDAEISDLRQKIGAIGSVNMEALVELEELEQRYTKMDEQYQDLLSAKQSLESIIQRINTDSRRLFVETLEAIRGNFQSLFRQTFGGGKADVVLEEGVDPLEAGVEIIATPPGKPEFNNSLLSGGEKALTAVSLLMAIFQFRPSPFCVLDEVDAPFDEANIGRFIDVLKSFLGWTKFVIVTHSKKTMTAATTLYGVTMQESGVSKRVSVRFEDVGEDGEITETGLVHADERGVA